MKKIVVMGVGNYILTDEGVGIHVIKELEKMQWPENVEIYDCGTTGILSFHKFVEADILIAIDSIAKALFILPEKHNVFLLPLDDAISSY